MRTASVQGDLAKTVSTTQHGEYQYGDPVKVVLTFAKAPPHGMSFDDQFGLATGEKFTVSGPAQGAYDDRPALQRTVTGGG